MSFITEHLQLQSALLSFQGGCWFDVKVPPGLPSTPNCFYTMNDIPIESPQPVPELTSSSTVPDQTTTTALEPAEASENTRDGDADVSSFVSFCTNASTPFDTILLAHSKNLRSEVDNIKLNFCNLLKVEVDQFATLTPTIIKNCSTLNKFTLADALLSLLSLSEKVCAVIGGKRLSIGDNPIDEAAVASSVALDSISGNATLHESLQAIQNSILKRDEVHNDTLKSISDQLNNLTLSIDQYMKPSDMSTPDVPRGTVFPSFPIGLPEINIEHLDPKIDLHTVQNPIDTSIGHIESLTPDFVDQELSNKLTEYLDTFSEQFDNNSERGHGVISFGDAYNYPGAKAEKPTSKTIPEPLTELVSLIQAKFPESVINQCLVNRYLDEKSELPKHSDNEASIMFDSNIFTISLGSTCDVLFSKIDGSDTKTVSASDKSLYVMSKKSQLVWQHQIDPSLTTREKRYSITFRYVASNNENATLILGDSNTRYLKFGSGKGRFGHRMPGKRVECFTIDKIDPSLCEGYRNIFIHCGVNDIKKRSSNIEQCASDLMTKLDDICCKCPYSKITVSPVLPTKFGWLNEKALCFNRLIFQYVSKNPRVGTLDFNEFVNEEGKLADQFGRFKDKSDAIHLGSTGIFKLSRLIVDKIERNPIDGRQFSDITRSKVGMFNSRAQSASKS